MANNIRRHKPATSNKMAAYFLHHMQSLVFSLGKNYAAPATTIMTVAVIGITLSLPGGFYLFLKNYLTLPVAQSTHSKLKLYHIRLIIVWGI